MNINEEVLTHIKRDIENLKLRIDALPVLSPLRRTFEKQKESLESQVKPENHSTSPAVNNPIYCKRDSGTDAFDFVGDQQLGLVGPAASPDIYTMINDDPTILTEEVNIADPLPVNPVGPIVSGRPSTLDGALAEIERLNRLNRVNLAEIDRLNRVNLAEIDRLNRIEVVRERRSSYIDGYLHAVNEMNLVDVDSLNKIITEIGCDVTTVTKDITSIKESLASMDAKVTSMETSINDIRTSLAGIERILSTGEFPNLINKDIKMEFIVKRLDVDANSNVITPNATPNYPVIAPNATPNDPTRAVVDDSRVLRSRRT